MPSQKTSVLLEGASDVAAVRALAVRAGVDLGRVRLVELGGVTNVAKALTELQQEWPDAEVLGLCDAAEAGVVVRALQEQGLYVQDAEDLPIYGFFVCVADLEEELIRALGADRAVAVIERLGLGGKLTTLRNQEAWRDRPLEQQLRRFCGSASGRKELLAEAFADALEPDAAPEPLRMLIDRLPR